MPKPVLLTTVESSIHSLQDIVKGLNLICKHLKFKYVTTSIEFKSSHISNPEIYKKISKETTRLLKAHSGVLMFTDIPYENNYFYESNGAVTIFSLADWSILTSLNKSNGVVGFIAGVLSREIAPGLVHEQNTGCIFDFLWLKTGIDARLRHSSVCRTCMEHIQRTIQKDSTFKLTTFGCTLEQGFEDLLTILDEVSMASKRQIDVLERWRTKAGVPEEFDVFLCHNSKNKQAVRRIYDKLVSREIRPWLDEKHLQPGLPWQRELEKIIPKIRSAAVLVGKDGYGPWQDMEQQAFLIEFANRGCPVIPVILPSVSKVPALPLFMRQFTWVDLRGGKSDSLNKLIWGITGRNS